MVRSGRVQLALFLFVFGFLEYARPAWSGDGDKPGSAGSQPIAVPADETDAVPAATPPLTVAQLKELKIGVKVETLLHRLGISVAQDIDAQPPQEQRAVERIQQTMQQIVTEYQNAGAPKTMVAKVRESLAHIGWRPVVHHLVAPIRNVGSSITAQGSWEVSFADYFNSKVSPPGKCDAYCSLADAIPQ